MKYFSNVTQKINSFHANFLLRETNWEKETIMYLSPLNTKLLALSVKFSADNILQYFFIFS